MARDVKFVQVRDCSGGFLLVDSPKNSTFPFYSVIPRMSQQLHLIKGEYVTAKIPVKTALLQTPGLLNYATPVKELKLPGMLTPEDFPNLMWVSSTISSLTGSPSSKAKVKTYDKAKLNIVKRKLQFTALTTPKSTVDQEMTYLHLKMTSLCSLNGPSSLRY